MMMGQNPPSVPLSAIEDSETAALAYLELAH